MPASFVCIAVYLYYNCYKKVSDKEIKVETSGSCYRYNVQFTTVNGSSNLVLFFI